MFKKSRVVMLPTEKAIKGQIFMYLEDGSIHDIYHKKGDISYTAFPFDSTKKEFSNVKPQHLYFLSNEEIKESLKEGDKILCDDRNHIDETPKYFIRTFSHYKNGWIATKEINGQWENPAWTKKIIASTELLCIKDNGGSWEEDDYLPRPSDSFIKKYCELGGINEVMVEYIVDENDERNWYKDCPSGKYWEDEAVKPSRENLFTNAKYLKLKLAPDNTITIKPVKDSWNREELEKLLFKIAQYAIRSEKSGQKFQLSNLDKWIEENL